MTYWYTAYCKKCKSHSPPLFVTSFCKVSLYPIEIETLAAAGEWVEVHAIHNPILLHEDDDKTPVSQSEDA